MNVYHEPAGLIFRKIQGEEGISYISIPVEDLNECVDPGRELLVRHGNPVTGRCGYYPLGLLFATPDHRERIARKSNKRPPAEGWVRNTLQILEEEGVKVLH
ncbi:hypothetical protein D3C76_25450 [compost metagenome]